MSADRAAVRALAPGSRFDRDDELLRLILDAFEYQRDWVSPPSSAFSESVENLARRRQTEWLVIGEDTGSHALAGCLIAELKASELYLSKLVVDRAHRKAGLGRRLIEHVLPVARQAGCTWLTLNVRIALEDNQAIFRRLGFEVFESGCHPGFDVPTYHRMRRLVA